MKYNIQTYNQSIRSNFRKEKNQNFGPELNYRSTSGRLSVDRGHLGRSSAGRLPVDRTKCVSSRFLPGRLVGGPVDRLLKTVHVCAHRSTAPLGRSTEVLKMLLFGLKIRFLCG